MNRAIGVMGDRWHTNEPQSETAVFERIHLEAGEETICSGAIATEGGLFVPSRAERTEDELRIHGIRNGTAQILVAKAGSAETFASSLSLVW